ncbi:MAG: Spy/CpxP family protein refolding chaperone [Nevskia sp.]|nr:Spy/CpxP family protein refolding chaperone [Nevskia sp.]
MRNALLLSIPLLAAALLATAGAQTEGQPNHFPHHSPMAAALQQVGLSDTQKQAIHQIMESHHDEMRNLFQSQRQLHETLAKTDPRSSDYAAQVGDIAQQAAALAAQHVQLSARLKSEIYGALTDTQKTLLTTALAAAKPEPEAPSPPAD